MEARLLLEKVEAEHRRRHLLEWKVESRRLEKEEVAAKEVVEERHRQT